MDAPPLETIEVEGLKIAYRSLGAGRPVLLLHGWPTSSFLWREVMRPIARSRRVLAPDLPGFGASDKPLDVRYGFDLFERILDGLAARLALDRIGLAVHDLGGPVGLHWALHRPGLVGELALLNTLVYPELSPEVVEFVRACRTPGEREKLTSPAGLEAILRAGLADGARLDPAVLAAVLEPFQTDAARRALAGAGVGISRRGMGEVARALPSFRGRVRIIYGARDRLLGDVAQTMARVKADLPQAEVTVLPECGHFLQEDAPAQVGELLAGFFAS
jgi:pimeloyl-ACP methyl ester carboxylesterase